MDEKKRNLSIELFRCIMMLGICLLHALDQGGYSKGHRGLDNILTPCVNGFLFISGYYGVHLRIKGVLKLLGIGLYCSFIISMIHGIYIHSAILDIIKSFWKQFITSWFLWTYLALMITAPLLESLFLIKNANTSKFDILKQTLPFLFMIFGWSYVATKIPVLKEVIPNVYGFGAFGLLTFIGVYIAVRLCRYYNIEEIIRFRYFVLLSLLSGFFCWFNFMHYHSPFALVFAGSLFFIFKKIQLNDKSLFGKSVTLLAPSMFSVYLLHMSPLGMSWLQYTEDKFLRMYGNGGMVYYSTCIYVALILFVVSVLLDLIRRSFLFFLKIK